jgi:hypothetical protein
MKILHVVLICLLIFAIVNYTAAAFGPFVQRDSLVPKEKTVLYNLLNLSPREKPGLITLGDPIEDPIPREK